MRQAMSRIARCMAEFEGFAVSGEKPSWQNAVTAHGEVPDALRQVRYPEGLIFLKGDKSGAGTIRQEGTRYGRNRERDAARPTYQACRAIHWGWVTGESFEIDNFHADPHSFVKHGHIGGKGDVGEGFLQIPGEAARIAGSGE